jgi:hypothetical protein
MGLKIGKLDDYSIVYIGDGKLQKETKPMVDAGTAVFLSPDSEEAQQILKEHPELAGKGNVSLVIGKKGTDAEDACVISEVGESLIIHCEDKIIPISEAKPGQKAKPVIASEAKQPTSPLRGEALSAEEVLAGARPVKQKTYDISDEDATFARAVGEESGDHDIRKWAEDYASGKISESVFMTRIAQHTSDEAGVTDLFNRAAERVRKENAQRHPA